MPARLLLLVVALGLIGCGESGSFRAETILRPDGTVTRRVLQPAGEFAGDHEAWEAVSETAASPADQWRSSLATYEPKGEGALLAVGTFGDAGSLPAHVRIGGDDAEDADAGLLVRDVTITDFGVLKEYRWTETLTAGTSPLRVARSRRAAISLAAWWCGAALEAGLPPGTDASGLERWVRVFGDRWAEDLFAVLYGEARSAAPEVSATETPLEAQREMQSMLADVCGDYGLDVRGDDGVPLQGRAAADAVERFTRRLLRGHVNVGGRGLSGEEVDRAFALLTGQRRSADGTRLTLEPAADDILAVRDAVLERRFGTADMKEIGESLAPELRGLWGAGFLRIFAANEFVYRHRSPGLLMETNGTLLGSPDDPAIGGESCEVLFRFDVSDAFVFGRPMFARSVVVDHDRQREWFGEPPVTTREQIAAFLQAMEDAPTRQQWEEARAAADARRMRNLLP